MDKIEVKEVGIKEVLNIHQYVLEMDDLRPPKTFFTDRIDGLKSLITAAYHENTPIGYMISYQPKDDLESIYCWLAGVDYRYRRLGALTELMKYHMNWAKENGYQKMKIKTRNDKRNMLNYLVKNGWNFTKVEEAVTIESNSIYLEKNL